MATTSPIRVAWLGEPLGIPETATSPRRRRRELQSPARRYLPMLRETAIVLVMALVLSFAMKTFLVQAFLIPSGSMENTMLVDDRVIVNKLAAGPFDISRGDIVVFDNRDDWNVPESDPVELNAIAGALKNVMVAIGLYPPDDGEHIIKRVIGLGGDTVQCCDAQGRLVVNGVSIDEPYIFAGDSPSDQAFTVVVPEGRLWVMGDHRGASGDSRSHMFIEDGTISEDAVVGVAFAVLWPANRASLLTNPSEVFATVPDPKAKGNP